MRGTDPHGPRATDAAVRLLVPGRPANREVRPSDPDEKIEALTRQGSVAADTIARWQTAMASDGSSLTVDAAPPAAPPAPERRGSGLPHGPRKPARGRSPHPHPHQRKRRGSGGGKKQGAASPSPAPPPPERKPSIAVQPATWGALRDVVKSGGGQVVRAVIEGKDQAIEQVLNSAEQAGERHRQVAEKLNKLIMEQRAVIIARDQELAEARRDAATAHADVRLRDSEIKNLQEQLKEQEASAALSGNDPGAKLNIASVIGRGRKADGMAQNTDMALRARVHLLQVRLQRLEEKLYRMKQEYHSRLEALAAQAKGVSMRWDQVGEFVRDSMTGLQRWLQAQMRKVWGFAQIAHVTSATEELGADASERLRIIVGSLVAAANELMRVFADEQIGGPPLCYHPVDLDHASKKRRKRSLAEASERGKGNFQLIDTEQIESRKDRTRDFNDLLAGIGEVSTRCKVMSAAVGTRRSCEVVGARWKAKLEESSRLRGALHRIYDRFSTSVGVSNSLPVAADTYCEVLRVRAAAEWEEELVRRYGQEAEFNEAEMNASVLADEDVIRGDELHEEVQHLPPLRAMWQMRRIVCRARFRAKRRMLLRVHEAAAEKEDEDGGPRKAPLTPTRRSRSRSRASFERKRSASHSREPAPLTRNSSAKSSVRSFRKQEEQQTGRLSRAGFDSPARSRRRSPRRKAEGGRTRGTMTIANYDSCCICSERLHCVECTQTHRLELLYPPAVLVLLKEHQEELIVLEGELQQTDAKKCDYLRRMLCHLAELGLVPQCDIVMSARHGDISGWLLEAMGHSSDVVITPSNMSAGFTPLQLQTPATAMTRTTLLERLHAKSPLQRKMLSGRISPRGVRPLSPHDLNVRGLQDELSVPVAAFLAAHPAVLGLLHDQSRREEEDAKLAKRGSGPGLAPALPEVIPRPDDRRYWESLLKEERARELRRREALRQLAQGLSGIDAEHAARLRGREDLPRRGRTSKASRVRASRVPSPEEEEQRPSVQLPDIVSHTPAVLVSARQSVAPQDAPTSDGAPPDRAPLDSPPPPSPPPPPQSVEIPSPPVPHRVVAAGGMVYPRRSNRARDPGKPSPPLHLPAAGKRRPPPPEALPPQAHSQDLVTPRSARQAFSEKEAANHPIWDPMKPHGGFSEADQLSQRKLKSIRDQRRHWYARQHRN